MPELLDHPMSEGKTHFIEEILQSQIVISEVGIPWHIIVSVGVC